LIGLAKIETWDNKLMGWLFDLWDAIPVKRGELDLDAAKKCLATLKEGSILGVAPEGTRSYNGSLQRGEPGIVLFALHSGAPIVPIAHWGGEKIGQNLKRLKRTDFHIRVGKPFTVSPGSEKMNGMIRQTISDEIMWQIAQLMPVEYRGEYVNYNPPATQHLVFI
jgi:1-acyl-sn-glycerol-3-phosphate acyltransferase